MKNTVAILGASNKPERYSYKALKMLEGKNYNVIPVNPVLKEIDGVEVTRSLEHIKSPIDTLTLYIKPQRVLEELNKIITLKPRRIIFNPGTEDSTIKEKFEENDIECVEACTLVLLSTNQF